MVSVRDGLEYRLTLHGSAGVDGHVLAEGTPLEAVPLVRPDEVHPTDEGGLVARDAKRVRPRGYAGVEHVLVRPDPVAGGECGPS